MIRIIIKQFHVYGVPGNRYIYIFIKEKGVVCERTMIGVISTQTSFIHNKELSGTVGHDQDMTNGRRSKRGKFFYQQNFVQRFECNIMSYECFLNMIFKHGKKPCLMTQMYENRRVLYSYGLMGNGAGVRT